MLENRVTETIAFQDEIAAGVVIEPKAPDPNKFDINRQGSLERLLKKRKDQMPNVTVPRSESFTLEGYFEKEFKDGHHSQSL